MKRFLIFLVKIYQITIPPITPKHCRFEPSCSNYAIEAIKTHGSIKGCWLTLKRLLKCHPWGKEYGYDPVPPKKQSTP